MQKLTVALIGCVAVFGVCAADVYFLDPEGVGDIADASAWSATPTTSDTAWITNRNGALTAKRDATFGKVKVQNTFTSAAGAKTVVFDLTEPTSGGAPRMVNVIGFNVGQVNETVELKGGIWNWAGAGADAQGKALNMINGNGYQSGNNHIILSAGAVVTNLTSVYAWIIGDRYSDITLKEKSRMHLSNNAWFLDGRDCALRITDGSRGLMGTMMLGRSSAYSLNTVASNRIEVTGAGSFLRTLSYASTGVCIGPNATLEGPCANSLIVKDHAGFHVNGSDGAGPMCVGCRNKLNTFWVDDYAVSTSGTISVGLQAGGCSNTVFVGAHATMNVSVAGHSIDVGCAEGAIGNALIVSNGTLNAYSIHLGSSDISKGASSYNLFRVIGSEAVVSKPNGNLFQYGHHNTFEIDGATIDWGSSSSIMLGGTFPSTNNTVRLLNGAGLKIDYMYVGNANGVDNTLWLEGPSHVALSWNLVIFPKNTLHLTVPKSGYALVPIHAAGTVSLEGSSVLDLEVEDGYDSDQWQTLVTAGEAVSIPDSVLATAKTKLGKEFILRKSADGKSLLMKKKTGLMLLLR